MPAMACINVLAWRPNGKTPIKHDTANYGSDTKLAVGKFPNASNYKTRTLNAGELVGIASEQRQSLHESADALERDLLQNR